MTVNASGFQAKMDALRKRIPKIQETSIARLGLFAEREMKKEAPVRTTRLRVSIEAVVQKDHATVGTSVSYAEIVARGSRPHRIEPKTKKALANKKTGFGPVRGVNHPGTKANPFDLRALASLKANATAIVNATKNEMTADLR